MESTEISSFETSEMLANVLSSTPLLSETWKLCTIANNLATAATPQQSFVMDQIGSVGYIGFPGAQVTNGLDLDMHFMPLAGVCDGIFSVLEGHGSGTRDDGADQEPVMVHSGLFKLFWNAYSDPSFRSQIQEMLLKSKSIILTGHSVGGGIASLMALSLLAYLETIPALHAQVLCITFGSPLLGNASFSQAILRQKWGGNFCHVVLKHDIMPRLFFAPVAPIDSHLRLLLQYWQLSSAALATSSHMEQLFCNIPDQEKASLFNYIVACTQARASDGANAAVKECFMPFGTFLFCSEAGVLCVENVVAVVRLLFLMLATADANSGIQDHLKYGEYVQISSFQFLKRKEFTQRNLPEVSYEAGLSFAVESLGLAAIQETISESTKDCLRMDKQKGQTPNLNSARLAIGLSKIAPRRAQIEWYKACCDKSDDQMGYYDTFKKRQALRRDSEVNLFRLKLAGFWDGVIKMIDENKLPHDFHKRAKWINASRFYQLLVEPLDIAEYYRSGMHQTKGHYLQNGRERRFLIFDKWWRVKHANEEKTKRTKFAGLTQDPCFWARLEEARDKLEKIRSESDPSKLELLWDYIQQFENYAKQLIHNMEVSIDVLARNSSYTIWVEELAEIRQLRSQLQQYPSLYPSHGLENKLIP